MQKVLDFLERHVQWVAIAIAAVFLLYTLSSYLPGLAQPISVEIDGEKLGPGEVDPHIKNKADELQARIDAPVKVPLVVPDPDQKFREQLNHAEKVPTWPSTLMLSRPVDQSAIAWDSSNTPNSPGNGKVASLPTLPAVILEPAPSTGFAQVTMTAPGAATPAAPADAGAAIGAAGAPAAAATPAVPVAAATPAAGGAPAAGAAAAVGTDTTWVRVPFSIPAARISQAFGDVNLPANLTLTSFLRVELIRQKQLPGNAWGPEEVVDPLPTLQMPTLPPEGPQSFNAQQQYLSWANSNPNTIVQPEFFPVIAGADPRFEKPADAVAAESTGTPAVFDAETFPANGDLSTLTPEQKAAVLKVRQRKAKEAEAAKPKGVPSGPSRGGRGGGGGPPPGMGRPGGAFAAPAMPTDSADIGGGIKPFQQRAPQPGFEGGPPPGYPGAPPGMGLPPGAAGGYPGAPGFPGAQAAPTQIVVTPLPPAPFDPGQVQGGIIQGWAYDVTAAADSTYRYRVRYRLKNPIFGVQNVASKPELITQFALVGEDTNGWTQPITIAPLTHVFLSALPTPGATRVGFTVFRWQAGQQHRTNVFVGPGDSIGKTDAGIDYRTHWTLVEVRRDSSSGSAYALLMNADGVLKKLDYDADRATPLFQQLNAEVDGPAAANGAANGAAGAAGGPPRPAGAGATPPQGRPGAEAPAQ